MRDENLVGKTNDFLIGSLNHDLVAVNSWYVNSVPQTKEKKKKALRDIRNVLWSTIQLLLRQSHDH